MATSPLFDRLGGAPVVKLVVDEFYKRLLDDDRLAHFFEDTKIAKLKNHQLQFLKLAFTEIPEGLDVHQMLVDKHRRLFIEKGLNASHFDMVVEHLVASLQNHQVSQHLINEAADIVVPLRPAFERGAVQVDKSDSEEKKDELSSLNFAMRSAATKETLMDKLGGAAAVKLAVEGMYTRILADPKLAVFFQDANLTALKMHMVDFMKIAFTQVPIDFDVPTYIQRAHAQLFNDGLNASHFDLVVGHFVATLESLHISQDLIHEATLVILPLRPIFEQSSANTSA